MASCLHPTPAFFYPSIFRKHFPLPAHQASSSVGTSGLHPLPRLTLTHPQPPPCPALDSCIPGKSWWCELQKGHLGRHPSVAGWELVEQGVDVCLWGGRSQPLFCVGSNVRQGRGRNVVEVPWEGRQEKGSWGNHAPIGPWTRMTQRDVAPERNPTLVPAVVRVPLTSWMTDNENRDSAALSMPLVPSQPGSEQPPGNIAH